MGSIWAIARQTIAQCLRMRVAATFLAGLGLILLTIPFFMKGDGTLAGRIRTFLSHATALTGFFLTIVSIFVGAGAISLDVRDKQIFSLDTKPLARWQYVLGRWGGIVLLDIILLAAATCWIYGLAQYLRQGQAINPNDRRAVESEVFCARRYVSPDTPDSIAVLRQRIDKLMHDGDYDRVLESYKTRTGGDAPAAQKMLEEELFKEIEQARQSAGPRSGIRWTFTDIHPGGGLRGEGKLLQWYVHVAARVQADARLVSQLVVGGPVQINGLTGKVAQLESDGFVVEFPASDVQRLEQDRAEFAEGKDVSVVAEPTIQISYTVSPTGGDRSREVTGVWIIANPRTGFQFREERTDAAQIATTLTVPARAVSDAGKLVAIYVNLNNASVIVPDKDISVVYRVGAFEENLIRAMLLVLLQLMFVSALGVMMGSFLSFPVACLASFVVLPFGLMRNFLADATRELPSPDPDTEYLMVLGRWVFRAMKHIIPNLEQTSPADNLVDGRYIPWMFVGETALWILLLSTGVLLAITWLVFRKRELARVQV